MPWPWKRVGARGEGLCHPHFFIMEEQELQNQLLGDVPAWGLGSLALSCVFSFHLLALTFHQHFPALGGGLEGVMLRGTPRPGSTGLFESPAEISPFPSCALGCGRLMHFRALGKALR